MKTIKFDKNHSKDFITELRKSVEEYFKRNNKSRFGNANMVFKSIFMLSLYFIPYGLVISGSITNSLVYWLLCVFMGVGMAGIGLSVMHDANHGSYSSHAYTHSNTK
jgi:linoleoyl-CoA desaturase